MRCSLARKGSACIVMSFVISERSNDIMQFSILPSFVGFVELKYLQGSSAWRETMSWQGSKVLVGTIAVAM